MPSCKTCGATVRWVTMEGSMKAMPIDPEPAEDGNLVCTLHGRATWAHVETLFDEPGDRYLSHFATCHDAKEHRRD